jgi:hypothetical protein
MNISLADISEAFNALASNSRSREDIAAWASEVQKAHDAQRLSFSPSESERQIWQAIRYLIGVDLKTSSTEYLHNTDDFNSFRQKWNV